MHFSMHSRTTRPQIQKIVDAYDADTGLNAVELDVKNESGEIGFTEGMPSLAISSGAAQNFYEPRVIVEQLHAAGFYVIGRVVAFEDPIIAEKAPKRAIRTKDGATWKNHAGLGWMNPYTKANWTYLVDVAKAAGKVGFDEIQFDYVRFPTDGDLTNVKLNRTKAKMEANIAAFLQHAVDELHPLKLRVSADLFGLAATRDLGIGQNPRQIAKIVDVMSPMIYPQGYCSGEYNIDCPVCNPRDLVARHDARLAEGDRRRHRRAAPVDPGLRLARPSRTGPSRSPRRSRASREFTERGFLLWDAGSEYDPALLKFPAAPVSGAEDRARELGLVIPDFQADGYYGGDFGSMKSHHVVNRVLYLSGHVPEGPDGPVNPGRLGRDVTIEQGYAAARQTGLNCLAGIRYAVGSLDRVQGLVRNLCFVAAAPDFTDVHLVSSGCSDLLRDVFGPEAGLGGRATIGVQSLAHDHCFECWLEVELVDDHA